ncbi:MAG TPA: LytR C-terminal domain-containing protein [Ilumatobacteraceae bacterium]|nr:LytR C-terminal domain-containing protein [Ilumatobacteraceae bacterium]
MSNEQPSSRPPKRSGSGSSPMGSTLAIVIAIAAVVVGFLILKNIRSDDDNSTAPTTPTSTTLDPLTTTTFPVVPVESTTTSFTPQTSGASVIVANSSHANGAAGQLSTALQANGFTMGTPTNGSTKEPVTKVQYLTGDVNAQAVAQSVAQLMGVAAENVEPIPTPVLLGDPTLLADNTVVVLLGDDKASKTLAQMTEATTTTVAGADAGATTSSAAP